MRNLCLVIVCVASSLLFIDVADANCRVAGKDVSLGNVDIRARGGSFKIEAAKVTVTVLPITAGVATVQVRSPLRFTLRGFSIAKMPFRTSRRTVLLNGRLVLAAGIETKLVNVTGGFVNMTPTLQGLTIRTPVRAPCRSLKAIDHGSRYYSPMTKTPTGAFRNALVKAGGVVALYPAPGRGTAVWLKVTGAFEVVGERKGWVHVRRTWSGGSSLRGWVSAKSVLVATSKVLGPGGRGGGTGSGSLCGGGHRPAKIKLTIRRNAAIAANVKGTVWARTTKRLEVNAIATLRADGWVRIADLPGFPAPACSDHDRVWVHRRDVIWKK